MMSVRPHRGFTLVELAVVLVIIGVLAGMTTMGASTVDSMKRGTTSKKLDAIENALMAYRTVYNRLPCPADPTLATTNASYGAEAGTAGTCTGGAIKVDSVNHVVEGAIPFKVLGLPEEFMYDAWGRKFDYAVLYAATGAQAMLSTPLSDMCGITVNNSSSVNRSTGAFYTLVSYGQDGHGGYDKNGNRVNAGSTNSNEQTNCHCNASASETTYAASYVQMDRTEDSASSTDLFDDQVRYKERWQLMTFDDMYLHNATSLCGGPGFRVNGGTTNGSLGMAVATGDVNGDGIQDLIIGQNGSGGNAVYVIFGTNGTFPNPLPVSSLNGSNGFKLTTVASYYNIGTSIAAGDLDHDGYADIIVGDQRGDTFVFYGASSFGSGTYDLDTMTACQGFDLLGYGGAYNYSEFGGMVAVGDVNNDGIADLVVSDPTAGTADTGTVTFTGNPANATYVNLNGVHWTFTTGAPGAGKTVIQGTLAATLTQLASNLNASSNNSIKVASYSASATVLTVTYKNGYGSAGNTYSLAVGTVAGDSVSGAHLAGGTSNGAVYVMFGQGGGTKTCPGTGTLNGSATSIGAYSLSSASSPKGSIINSDANNGNFGLYALAIGDVNHDGYKDVIIGDALYGAHNNGRLVIVFGQATWPDTIAVGSLAGSGSAPYGTVITAPNIDEGLGGTLATGDVTGDGITDIVGQDGTDQVAVFQGHANPWAASYSLATPAGAPIEILQGNSGISPSVAVGDVNGDGKPDLIFSDQHVTTNGSVYALFGPITSAQNNWNVETTAPNGTNGVRIDCSYSDGTSCGVGNYVETIGTGDLNGDGIPDVIIGVPGGNVTGSNDEGYTYVLFGKKSGWTTPYALSTIY